MNVSLAEASNPEENNTPIADNDSTPSLHDPTIEPDKQDQTVGHYLTTFSAVALEDLLCLGLPERGHLLDPIFPKPVLAMLFAPTGTGKTYAALSIAYAVASGGEVFKWQSPSPKPVLYLDGEMSARVMKERLAQIVAGASQQAPPGFFKIVTPDLVPDGIMPNLAKPEGRELLEPLLDEVDLIVVDNIATLARVGRENEAESWLPVQSWLLVQRRAGRSVLLVHHAGKGGQQRGTSAREDILDTVISLTRPSDYQTSDGARFVVNLTKARGLTGQQADPFEVAITDLPTGGLGWAVKDLKDLRLEQVTGMKNLGMTIREIAEETGIPRSTVYRLTKKLEGE
ncbi:AAA family ATPase [Desulfoferula mesophila]|uniref:AAA+ ATPase domain-containing protein n=1 Tax=Desulfoferula mesophila TaxID=3058419 RepID=A0AAU9EFS7_9BACT|nr:hypothetical protein FAK_30890 [Desulfoferula mesophilus]